MKKRFLLIASLLALSNEVLIAQQTPTGTPPANVNATNNPILRDLAERAWYRGGNNPGGAGGTNNVFGTLWNSPIYTVTNGVNRTKLNGNFTANGATAQYTINGYGFGNTQQTVNPAAICYSVLMELELQIIKDYTTAKVPFLYFILMVLQLAMDTKNLVFDLG